MYDPVYLPMNSTNSETQSSSISIYEWLEDLPSEYTPAPTDYTPVDSTDENQLHRPLKRPRDWCSPLPRKRRVLEESDLNKMDAITATSRRSSPRRLPKASSQPKRVKTPELSNEHIDTDATPKSNKDFSSQLISLDSLRREEVSAHTISSRSSVESSSQKSKSRSMSPSKRMKSLQLAKYSMEWRLFESTDSIPQEGLSVFLEDIRNIADGEQIISHGVAELANKHSRAHRIKSYNICQVLESEEDELSDGIIFNAILEIRSATIECREEHLSEASWNDEVHSRLLNIAFRGFWRAKGVWYRNVTSTKIDDRLFLETMQSRMVDYCITLGNSQDHKQRIIEFLRRTGLDSINHASSPDICFTPIAVSIETKRGKIDEDDAMHQLATWVAAQFAFLRRLVRPGTTLPPLVLVMVQGHEWNLMIATSNDSPATRGVIYRDIHMGETTTVLGICKVIKSLRRIAKYITENYWSWFEKEVLG